MSHSQAFATRLRWLRLMSVACIVGAALNLLWGAAMLLVVPGWRTVVSWSVAAVAIGAAAYARHVMRVLRDVSHNPPFAQRRRPWWWVRLLMRRRRLLLQIEVRDAGPTLSVTFDMPECERRRAESLLAAAQAALDHGRAQAHSMMAEAKFHEWRHGV